MKKMILNAVLSVFLCLVTSATYAQIESPPEGDGTGGSAGIIELLSEIKALVKTFYESWDGYYGAGNEQFVAPERVKTANLEQIKQMDEFLATVYQNSTSLPAGREMTVKDLIMMATTPRDYKACVNCDQDNILSVGDLITKDIADNFASVPYNLELGLISKSKITQLRNDVSSGTASTKNVPTLDSLVYKVSIAEPSQDTQRSSPLSGLLGGAAASSEPQQATSYSGANNFIRLASGLSTPIRIPNTLPKSEISEATGQNPRNQALIQMLTFLSRQSVGLSNLNQMLARRIKPQGNDAKSVLEVEHEMANRRLSVEWHDKMEKANSLTLQRETLYLLAEMNKQLYQERMMQERLLATVSIFQLQNLDFTKMALDNSL